MISSLFCVVWLGLVWYTSFFYFDMVWCTPIFYIVLCGVVCFSVIQLFLLFFYYFFDDIVNAVL